MNFSCTSRGIAAGASSGLRRGAACNCSTVLISVSGEPTRSPRAAANIAVPLWARVGELASNRTKLSFSSMVPSTGVGSHLGLRISNLVPKKPSNVRISTQNILTFDGFASPLELQARLSRIRIRTLFGPLGSSHPNSVEGGGVVDRLQNAHQKRWTKNLLRSSSPPNPRKGWSNKFSN